MAIFTHVTVGTNDLAKARAFYDSVLAPLGLKRLKDFGDGGSCWGQSTEEFMVLKPADGKPATHANGGTISFEAPSRAAVAAFHKAALAAGGKDEGAVGPRGFWPNAYAGYVRDLSHSNGIDIGLGAQVTIDSMPDYLERYYGDDVPLSFEMFFRVRPSLHAH